MHKTAGAAAPPAELRRKIVEELDPVIGPRISSDALGQAVERALRDLRGSVAPEALPEMAVRLARHRMLGSDDGPHQTIPARTRS
ncbi:MAG TPA: hypothetical protein VFU36_05645 [Jatrophihabitans sp.]|nr:hypothetical protein [Jatrophihabitans sp.]